MKSFKLTNGKFLTISQCWSRNGRDLEGLAEAFAALIVGDGWQNVAVDGITVHAIVAANPGNKIHKESARKVRALKDRVRDSAAE